MHLYLLSKMQKDPKVTRIYASLSFVCTSQSDYLYPGLGVPDSRYGGGDANGNSNNLETFQKINQMLENSLDLSNLGGGDANRRGASTGGQ